MLNLIFAGLNRNMAGLGIHIGFAVLHIVIFSLDYFFKKKGYKKQKKWTQTIFVLSIL